MEININEKRTILSIQKEFQKKFPFLKLEFFKRRHTKGEGSLKENRINNKSTIAEVQQKKFSGKISISGNMKVSELESAFNKFCGLSVQVFRKSGKVWLQTTATDDWTLDKQNKKGVEKSLGISEIENVFDAGDRQELE